MSAPVFFPLLMIPTSSLPRVPSPPRSQLCCSSATKSVKIGHTSWIALRSALGISILAAGPVSTQLVILVG